MTDEVAGAKAPPGGNVQVFGLDMPPTMFARILAAARGLYPVETAGKSDAAAAQAALKTIIVDLVAKWEIANASPPLPDLIQKATDDATGKQRAAGDAARNDGDTQIQPTVTT